MQAITKAQHKKDLENKPPQHAKLYLALFSHPTFEKISPMAKVVYCLLRNRLDWSYKKNRVDKDGYLFVYYTREQLAEDLKIGVRTASTYLKELMEFGLIDKIPKRFAGPNLIYIYKFEDFITDDECLVRPEPNAFQIDSLEIFFN